MFANLSKRFWLLAAISSTSLSCALLLGPTEGVSGLADQDQHGDKHHEAKAHLERGTESFWTAFHGDNYADLDHSLKHLNKANKKDPENPEIVHQLFFAKFWQIGEMSRIQPPVSPEEEGRLFGEFGELNAQAAALNPDDNRMEGWLGATVVLGARAQGNAELELQGRDLLAKGRERFPVFGNFMTVIAYADQPVNHPDWALALDALWATVDLCAGTKIDRKNPDLSPYFQRPMDSQTERVCRKSPKAPHLEGTYLYFADLLVKNGDIEAAKVMYRNTQLADGYKTWRDRPIVEERLKSDLVAHSALYHDENPSNDPDVKIAKSCTSCHAK